jgi:hypothetical protein
MTHWKAITITLLFVASSAWAGGSSLAGLLLFSVKDLDKVNEIYSFTLNDGTATLPDGTRCELKRLVKMYAAPVDADVGSTGDTIVDFLCYKLKCPSSPAQVLTVSDAIGVRSMKVKNPKLFCTPGG